MPAHWQRGDVIIVRYPEEDRMSRSYFATATNPTRGVIGWPHLVLSDTDACVAVYMPEGTPLWRWSIDEQRFRAARMSVGASVRLFFPGKRYEVSLFYDTRSGLGRAPWVREYFGEAPPLGQFHGWKVDIASPFARTRVGIDMIDDVLDIVVRPDRTHYWRDEDEMTHLISLGIYTEDEAEDLRQVGREVLDLVGRREPPFDDEWTLWTPPADLVMGERDLPEGWQFLPVSAPYQQYQPDAAPRATISARERGL
jgi:hypothetical protein